MPVIFEKTEIPDVVRVVFSDPINMDDMLRTFDEVFEYGKSQSNIVFVIMDTSQVKALGLIPGAMQIRTAELFRHPEKFFFVAVKVAVVGQMLGEMLGRLTGQNNAKFVQTMEEAKAVIEEIRKKPRF
jgi:hypothetical protein